MLPTTGFFPSWMMRTSCLPYVERLGARGTAVIWRELDRLMEDEAGDRRDEIVNEKLEVVGRHLSLVFHRFLSGEIKGHARISLTVNGRPITAFDPFCRKNPATQVLGGDRPHRRGRGAPAALRASTPQSSVRVRVRLLPDRSDFISNPGLRLSKRPPDGLGRLVQTRAEGEATKLARVQIDFPNSLDEADHRHQEIACPPAACGAEPRQIINRITARSVTVHRGRGQGFFRKARPRSGSATPITAASVSQSTSSTRSSHPWAQDSRPRMRICFCVLLDSIAASLPVEMIYSDYSTHPREINQRAVDESQTMERLRSLRQVLYGDRPGDAKAFLQIVRSTHLFDGQMELAEKFISEAFA